MTIEDDSPHMTFHLEPHLEPPPIACRGSDSLNEYVIEYAEDLMHRDTLLSPYRLISIFKWEPTIRSIMLVQQDSDCIILFSEVSSKLLSF